MIKLSSTGTLTVRPLSANLSRDTGVFRKMSPYVICIMGGFTSKTKTAAEANLNPIWSDIFTFNRGQEKELILAVWNQHMLMKDSLIGECTFPLENVLIQGRFEGALELKYKGEQAGKLNVRIEWRPANIDYGLQNRSMHNASSFPIMNNPNQQPLQMSLQRPMQIPNQMSHSLPLAMPPQNQQYQPYPPSYNIPPQQPFVQSNYPCNNNNTQAFNQNNNFPMANNFPPPNNNNFYYPPPPPPPLPISKNLNPGLFGDQNIPASNNNTQNLYPPINEVAVGQNQGFEYPKQNEVMTDIDYQRKMAEMDFAVKK